jgi:sugar/nucleoside kinase (ribokinase family)
LAIPSYDLVFAGNIAFDEIHPFGEEAHTVFGSAVYIAAMAAAWSEARVALVARMAESDRHMLQPLQNKGVAVHVSPSSETTRHRSVHLSDNVDEREVTQTADAGFFTMRDMPEMEPTHIHLASVTDRDFQVDFIRELTERGFRCSVDMQGFVRQVKGTQGAVVYADVEAKREIAGLSDSVKMDVLEAEYLCGTRDPEEAAAQFERWGTKETMVTHAGGALVRHQGKSYYERFTNRSVAGRTGRGDSVFGSYLARRLEYGVAESLKFAAALASIKVEVPGPFAGTLQEVLDRMKRDYS